VQGTYLVINYFYGPIVNAARGVAAQVHGGVTSFVSNITTPVRPQVTQSYAIGNVDRTISLTFSVSKISSAILLILSIPASIEINYLLDFWLGDAVPDYAASFTVLVLATQLVNGLNAAISNVVHATGIMKEYQLWSSMIRLCSIPLAIVLLNIFSIPELSLVAVLICSCLSHFVGLLIVRKLVPISLSRYFCVVVLPILFVLVVSVILVIIPHILLPESLFRLILVSICSFIVISILFYKVAFDDNERQLTNRLLSPVLNVIRRV